MRIHFGTIESYLRYLTSMTFVDTPDPLAEMAAFDSAIDAMAAAARREGNLGTLQLALDSLIAEPAGRIEDFRGEGYPFSQEQFVALLTYASERIWPGVPVSGPGEAMPVEFVQMSRADWLAETGGG